MPCLALNRFKKPCGMPPVPGEDWCDTPGHREKVLARRIGERNGLDLMVEPPAADLVAAAEAEAPPSPPPPPPPAAPVARPEGELPPDFFGVGAAPPPGDDGLPGGPPPPSVEGAPGAPADELPPLAPVEVHHRWTGKHVAPILAGPVNMLHARFGIEPLSPKECEAGGEALAPLLSEWLSAADPNSPYGAATLWIAVAYFPRLVEWWNTRAQRAGAAPAAAAPPPGAPPEPPRAPGGLLSNI